jgi:hypothetical protein
VQCSNFAKGKGREKLGLLPEKREKEKRRKKKKGQERENEQRKEEGAGSVVVNGVSRPEGRDFVDFTVRSVQFPRRC